MKNIPLKYINIIIIHKYEKSSTPNATEVKIMIDHGKEDLQRGVY